MAIKNDTITENGNPSEYLTMESVVESLHSFEIENISDSDITNICDLTIENLMKVFVPQTSVDLKSFKIEFINATNALNSIVKQANNPKKVFVHCLQTLYKELILKDKPSLAAGLIFNICNESLFEAIRLLLTSLSTENDDDIKKVIITLCFWLHKFNGFNNMEKCIIKMLNSLEELGKYDLLMSISNDTIEKLFLSLIIPAIQPNTVNLVAHILIHASSIEIFKHIYARIPSVLHQMKRNLDAAPKDDQLDIEKRFDLILDIIYVLMRKFSIHFDDSKKIFDLLLQYRPYQDTLLQLEVKPWYVEKQVKTRDPLKPIGLMNMGNTCYLNSVLQALFVTEELTHEILKLRYPSRLIEATQHLFALLLFSVRPEVVPNEMILLRPQSFSFGHQQDSFEYLGFLLDQLHEEEKRFIKMENGHTINGSVANSNEIIRESVEMDWDEDDCLTIQNDIDNENKQTSTIKNSTNAENTDAEMKKTIIENIFSGRATITYKCLECSSTSSIVDNFFDLQLAIPQPIDSYKTIDTKECTTQSLLNDYFKTEKLIEDDKYYCEKCKKLCDGQRDVQVERPPNNLILLMKHFKYDRKYNIRRKITKHINPNETIKLKINPITGVSFKITYRLYAMVVHSGMNIDSGHYYTIGTNLNGNWFNFNDNFVSPTTQDDIQRLNEWNTPYILFYKQVSSEKYENNLNALCNRIVNHSSGLVEENELPPILRDFIRKDNSNYKQNAYISRSDW